MLPDLVRTSCEQFLPLPIGVAVHAQVAHHCLAQTASPEMAGSGHQMVWRGWESRAKHHKIKNSHYLLYSGTLPS